jgi:ATP/ADP translocase
MTKEHTSSFARFMKRASKVEPNELKAVFLSFAFVFTLMASYYILRPIRDAMASEWSDAELSTLFTVTFVFSFVAGALCVVIFRILYRDSGVSGPACHWQGFLCLDQYFQLVPCVRVLEFHG